MSLIQKARRSTSLVAYVTSALFIASLFCATLQPNSSVSAIDGCPGQEYPGSPNETNGATDPNSCYSDGLFGDQSNAVKTSNTPTGVTPTGGPTEQSQDETSTDDGKTCAIEKIGWLVCPVTEFMGTIADIVYKEFLNELLKVEELSTDTSGPLYSSWKMMRNFANIAFIAAFLIVIYSQVTGVGITNYGIKKILPRLILSVIFVNLSYWICAIAVDLSNIVGSQLYVALQDMLKQPSLDFHIVVEGHDKPLTGNGWTAIVIAILSVGAVAYVGITVLLPALIFVLIAVVTVTVALTIRQALIIMLVVISPFAFVAYLLPNTESLFKKWFSLFKALLIMYPLIALIAGGSALASSIVMRSSDSMWVQLMGAAMVVVPLVVTPLVMKTAGGVLSKFGMNNPNKGVFDRMKNKAKDMRGNSAFVRGRNARAAVRKNYKDQKFAETMGGSTKKGRMSRFRARGLSGNAGLAAGAASSKLRGSTSRPGQMANSALDFASSGLQQQSTKLAASFAGAAEKIAQQDVKDQQALYSAQLLSDRSTNSMAMSGHTDFRGDALNGEEGKLAHILERAIINGDKAGAKAAADMLISRGAGGVSAMSAVMNSSPAFASTNTAHQGTRQELLSHITENHSALKGSDADIYSYAGGGGTTDLSAIQRDKRTYDSITNDQMATQSTRSLASAGANASIRDGHPVFDEKGNRVTHDRSGNLITRGTAILNSQAGEKIKQVNRSRFL